MRHLLLPVLACVLLGAPTASSHAQTDDNLPTTPESAALVELLSDYQADRRAVDRPAEHAGDHGGRSLGDRLEALFTGR